MPPGGDGVYYFSMYLLIQDGEWSRYDIRLNDDVICSIFPDHSANGEDVAPVSCTAVVNVVAGKGC